MRSIGKTLYTLFVVLLVAVAGLFLVSLLPISGNIEIKIVKSGSMEPTIRTGSIVIVKSEISYAVGDIVTFGEDTRRQIPTTHRIAEVFQKNGQTYYHTKGDANEEADPSETPESTVIGKVVFAVPYGGYILDFARQPIGFTFLIGIPAGLIIIDELLHIIGEVAALKRKRREKKQQV